jgi:hypothetical protein
MESEAHQVRTTLADIFPPLSIHKTNETSMGGNIEDGRIVRIDGKAVNVVELIDGGEPRQGRKTGAA